MPRGRDSSDRCCKTGKSAIHWRPACPAWASRSLHHNNRNPNNPHHLPGSQRYPAASSLPQLRRSTGRRPTKVLMWVSFPFKFQFCTRLAAVLAKEVGGFGRLAHKLVDSSNIPRVRSETVFREFILIGAIAWVFKEAYFFLVRRVSAPTCFRKMLNKECNFSVCIGFLRDRLLASDMSLDRSKSSSRSFFQVFTSL